MSIALEQVSKHYDGTPVVSDVSVSIADGELFVLLGPSGSGKSTLLRAIAGLTTIDHGRIVLHGRDVTNVSAREREVGFVFQNYALFRHMTVSDNIEFALRARGVPAAQRRKRRLELLRLVSLEGYGHRLPSELSGGQQQRVAVARALAHEPRVLLLDEPFGALDAKIRDELRRAIREIQRAVGITTILVTHDQEEAFTMADRIGVMERGRLQETDTPRALYARPRTRFVATFLGAANLLLGRHEDGGVRLGGSVLEADRWPHAVRPGAEATVVIRPEDVTLVPIGGPFPVNAIGHGTVAAVEFVGPVERIRVTAEASETLASAVRPAADTFTIEASRPAREAEVAPLAVGQRVRMGAKRVHVLPTPISSLRLLARGDVALNRLATSRLIRELAERMHIEPTRHDLEHGDHAAALRGLPVVPAGERQRVGPALELLERGARQVLLLGPDDRRLSRVLIHLQPSRAARDGALAAAGSLLRHLRADATLLVPAEERAVHGTSYRELLDLRNSALRLHGVDVRTETFRGSLEESLPRHLDPDASALLLVGLASLSAGRALLEEVEGLLAAHALVGVLIVCGGSEAEQRASGAAVAAAAAR
ncbi:MAG TPA: ABC transporter ATP-binding protein [Gammaproteobacteria bacterium]